MSDKEKHQSHDADRIATGSIDLAGMLPSGRAKRKHAYVVVQAGQKAGAVYKLGGPETTLGRSPNCDIELPDEGVSRTHAKLIRQGNTLRLLDLDSTNGTFVDQQRIEAQDLADGDRFELGGGTLLKVYFGDELEETLQRGLYESSVRDWITGLYNRRYLEERLDAEFAFAARHREPLALMLLEFTGIELISELHGRGAGDETLRLVAEALVSNTRTEDVVGRFEGQQFAVLARGATAAQAGQLAERIRRTVEGLQIPAGAGARRVTLNAGIACLNPTPYANKAALIEAADRALVEAKHRGKNKFAIAGEEPEPPA